MKLTMDDLKKLYVEMLENEIMKKESELNCEHEDAGDRV